MPRTRCRLYFEHVAGGVHHAAIRRSVRHRHGMADAAQPQAPRRIADVGQLARQAPDQGDFDCLLCHDTPVISATLLPRFAAMSSGVRSWAGAPMVARTTLIGLREP